MEREQRRRQAGYDQQGDGGMGDGPVAVLLLQPHRQPEQRPAHARGRQVYIRQDREQYRDGPGDRVSRVLEQRGTAQVEATGKGGVSGGDHAGKC